MTTHIRAQRKSPLAPMAGVMLAALLLTACSGDAFMRAYLQTRKGELHRMADPAGRPVQFVVEPGMSARGIAQKLQASHLIRDARLFEAYVRVNGLAGRLEAGTHTLSASMTHVQIAETLQHARAPGVKLTIPEGWRLEQIADHLAASGLVDGAAYRALARSGDLRGLSLAEPERYDFLNGRPAGASLEGYLYPDTYELPTEGATAAELLRKQLDRFADKALPVYREATARQPQALSLHHALTLASIVERETAVDEERATIAGVYLRRLAIGMKLEADPTVQYAMGYQPRSGQWWKTPVFLEEYKEVRSPYNTYLHAGLPLGPIANPGVRSLEAVLKPAKHDYLYMVAAADQSGRHVFATTMAEHLENVRGYQRGQ